MYNFNKPKIKSRLTSFYSLIKSADCISKSYKLFKHEFAEIRVITLIEIVFARLRDGNCRLNKERKSGEIVCMLEKK